jgi:replicative DNA helicase
MAEWLDDKAPLHSEEAEKKVLAYLYWNPTATIRTIQAEDFYTPKYRKIFSAIVNLKAEGKIPDDTQLKEYFSGQPSKDKRGLDNPTPIDILMLGNITSTDADITLRQNVSLLKDYSLRRKSKEIGLRIATAATNPSLDIEKELRTVGELIEQKEAETDKANLFSYPTMESLRARDEELKQMGKGDIKTSFYFHNKDNEKEIEQLTLPSGAITLVCALTSHGKSTFLRDIALEVAQNGQQGDTLFYTYESSEQEIEWGFINSYIKQPFNRGNNLQTIKDYEQTGKNWFAGNNLQTYIDGKERFRKELLCSGKLRLLRRSNDAAEIQDEIRLYNKRFKPIKCVFIDYIQKLHLKDNRLSRTEELSKICSSFEALAIELGIPVVMAAQLNRQTTDPVSMCSQNLAESTSIEQSSAKMVFLWNSTERARVDKESKELKNFAERTGITLGVGGQIYARLEKNRFGIRQAEAVFEYLPNTGEIKQQQPTQQQIEEWQRKQGQETTEHQQQPNTDDDRWWSGDETTDDKPF